MMFQQTQNKSLKNYNAISHLSKMITLLGMSSSKFIETPHQALLYRWLFEVHLPGGDLSKILFELYPSFGEDGIYPHLGY